MDDSDHRATCSRTHGHHPWQEQVAARKAPRSSRSRCVLRRSRRACPRFTARLASLARCGEVTADVGVAGRLEAARSARWTERRGAGVVERKWRRHPMGRQTIPFSLLWLTSGPGEGNPYSGMPCNGGAFVVREKETTAASPRACVRCT
jgi:hypothetical protein